MEFLHYRVTARLQELSAAHISGKIEYPDRWKKIRKTGDECWKSKLRRPNCGKNGRRGAFRSEKWGRSQLRRGVFFSQFFHHVFGCFTILSNASSILL
jgi:hypothetical protein